MASRLDFSQIRSLYVGTSSSTQVGTDNLVVAGNVGIGTTAPGDKLEIVGGAVIIPNGQFYRGRFNGGTPQNLIGMSTGNVIQVGDFTSSWDTQIGGNLTIQFALQGTERMRITSAGNVGIGTTAPTSLLSVQGNTDLGNSYGNTTSSLSTTRISGFALYQDASNRYGNYGVLILHSDTGWTASARRFMITNGLGSNKFAIIRSVDASTDPALGTAGSVASGTVDFEINNAGAATFGSSLTAVGDIQSNGIYRDYQGEALLQTTTGAVTQLGSGGAGTPRTLAFLAGNAERMRITSAGNVGIGTTAPAFTSGDGLEIQRSSATATLRLDSGVFATELRAYTDGTFLGQLSNAYLDLGTDNSTKVRITGAGDVGIGTTAPASRLQVDASGHSLVVSNDTGNRRIYFGTGATGEPDIQAALSNGTARQLSINAAGGNVGIGTTAPLGPLEVYRSNTGGLGGHIIVNNNGTAVGNETAVIFGDGASNGFRAAISSTTENSPYYGDLKFKTGANVYSSLTTKMIITGAGNVGIGNTSPTAKLQVGPEAHPSATGIEVAAGTGGANLLALNSSTNHNWFPYTDGSNYYSAVSHTFRNQLHSTDWMTITSDGNVGIGTTSPSYKLDVVGSARIDSTSNLAMFVKTNSAFGAAISYEDSTTGGNDVISAGAIGGDFYISTNYSERVRVTSAGNVGIGTTSPTEKLHVNGNAVLTYNNSYQGINSVGNKAILARVSPTTGIINYAEYATAANLNGFVMGSDDARVKGNIATDSLEFITNGSTQVTVLSNGNVGIANTNPSEKLSVTGNIRMDNGAADGPQLVLGSSGFSDWNIDNFSGSLRAYYGSTEYTRLTSSGNFGIGVSPSYKLDVAGDTRITSGSLGVGVVPNATDGRIDASNDIVAYSSSDRRLKENITPIANALDKVKSLTGVEFDWKPEHKKAHGYEGHDTGVIAQEVQEVMPTAVRTNDTGYLAVRYEKLIGLLIEANKELAARVEELEKKLK